MRHCEEVQKMLFTFSYAGSTHLPLSEDTQQWQSFSELLCFVPASCPQHAVKRRSMHTVLLHFARFQVRYARIHSVNVSNYEVNNVTVIKNRVAE